jgi:hypothetical protein
MFKKIVLSVLSALILLQATASYALAQQPATWYNQGLEEWYTKVYNQSVSPGEDIFGERYTAAQVDWIIWSVITGLPTKILNPDGTACLIGIFGAFLGQEGVDISESFLSCKDKIFAYNPDQAPYYAATPPNADKSLWSVVFSDQRPFSGIAYVKSLVTKITTTPTANAQGFGYTTALEPFKEMWTASRDIAYSLFVFAAIILAFMVMFKVKLSPQTAVTVQSAIPKLIIGLILVTFSYAIAGFMVDLMYVVYGLLSIVGSRFMPVTGSDDVSPVLIYNLMTIGPYLNIPVIGHLGTGLIGFFFLYLVLFAVAFLIVALLTLGLFGAAIVGAITLLAAPAIGTIALLLFFLLLVITIIIVVVMILKTAFALAKAFANVILLTIFAPFQLMLGTFIPSMGFGAWVKSFISNLGVFVGVSFMFLLATIFLWQAVVAAVSIFGDTFATSIAQGIGEVILGPGTWEIFTSGRAMEGWPPLLTWGFAGNNKTVIAGFYLIFSFIIFMQIPKTADMIKSFLSGRPWAFGSAIGEGLAAGGFFGAAYSGSGAKTAMQEYSQQGQASRAGWALTKLSEKVEAGSPGKIRSGIAQGLKNAANRAQSTPRKA